MIQVDHIDHMGTDLTVVNSARVSFSKESQFIDGQLMEKDAKLLDYLARHKHFTPFTHPQITLRETVPIFVARQRFKHTVGFTYNEESRRYIDSPPEIYIPDAWRSRPEGSVKQGSGDIHPESDSWKPLYQAHMETTLSLYQQMLDEGIAPEQARMVLPQSMMTSYYVTGSLAAFARLYQLRIDSHAQKEIQILAEKIGKVMADLYPVSWNALINQGV